MIDRRSLLLAAVGACVAIGPQCVMGQGLVAGQAAADDHTTVQRFDPLKRAMADVPAAEIKPGFLYNRYHAGLGRRVWSMATEGGGFIYAMAPGSVQPARALDLRGSEVQLRAALNARDPELVQMLDTRGGIAYVRLTPQETWQVVPQSTIANVYDLETLRRWEWHGTRRVPVIHTLGYEWLVVDGKFVPSVTSYGSTTACW